MSKPEPAYTPPSYPPPPNPGADFRDYTDAQWKTYYGWAAECLRIDAARHQAMGYNADVIARWRKTADEYEQRSR